MKKMEQMDYVDPQHSRPAPTPRARGRKPTKSGGTRDGHRRLTADIPSDLHKRLKMQALMEDCSVTDLVVQAAEYFVANRFEPRFVAIDQRPHVIHRG